MLFDLQSRRRRNAVKFIYGGLALLFGAGLVLFGVGTGTSGNGLFDLFNNNGSSTKSQVSAQEKRADRAVRLNPSDAAAWLTLARLRYQGANFDQTTGAFTADSQGQLTKATQAWNRYLALKPAHPDPNVARMMVNAYTQAGGLNDPGSAADTMELVTSAQPSAQTFGVLAQLAYNAGQIRKGDLATARAIALAPKPQRAQIKSSLANAKKTALRQQVSRAASQSGASSAGAPGAAPSTGAATTPSG
jgi:predicted Zn-dependent protease